MTEDEVQKKIAELQDRLDKQQTLMKIHSQLIRLQEERTNMLNTSLLKVIESVEIILHAKDSEDDTYRPEKPKGKDPYGISEVR